MSKAAKRAEFVEMSERVGSPSVSMMAVPPTTMLDVIPLSEIDGEPRVRDIDLAHRLGFERPRDIRKLIERKADDLRELGAARHVARPHHNNGTTVTEYWLNQDQAIYICASSGTPTYALTSSPRTAMMRSFCIGSFKG